MADQRKPTAKVVYLPGCEPGAPRRLSVEHEAREGRYHYIRITDGDRLVALFSCVPGRDARRALSELLRLEVDGDLEHLPAASEREVPRG